MMLAGPTPVTGSSEMQPSVVMRPIFFLPASPK